MYSFNIHTPESAPADAKPVMEQIKKVISFVPNLYGVLAESPAALNGYATLSGLFDKSSFTPVEKQVVLLSVSFENGCDYCMAAHSAIAKMQGASDEVVQALRAGKPVQNQKLEALGQFTRRVVQNRGRLSKQDVQLFLAAGYSKAQLLDVMLGVAMKTLSNYTNHIAETPLDSAFESLRWEHPEPRHSSLAGR